VLLQALDLGAMADINQYRLFLGFEDTDSMTSNIRFELQSRSTMEVQKTLNPEPTYVQGVRCLAYGTKLYFGGSREDGTAGEFTPMIGYADPTTMVMESAWWMNRNGNNKYKMFGVDRLHVSQNPNFNYIVGVAAEKVDYIPSTAANMALIIGKDYSD
jgi:hypothetical protein